MSSSTGVQYGTNVPHFTSYRKGGGMTPASSFETVQNEAEQPILAQPPPCLMVLCPFASLSVTASHPLYQCEGDR
jgi:hypothetical protein